MLRLNRVTDIENLKKRLGDIFIGFTFDKKPVFARDLKAENAMAILLKDAIKPNLVQTLEENPAIIHGGPFANIAQGTNTIIATKMGLSLSNYVVTEAGFGADLGAEKFLDIKCRSAKLSPSAVVIVATIRALKYHGGVQLDHLNQENLDAIDKGFENLERHLYNVTENFKLPAVVCINHFTFDTDAETNLLIQKVEALGVKCIISKHWAEGGAGAEELAHAVVEVAENHHSGFEYLYDNELPLWGKIEAIAIKTYGAKGITASDQVRAEIDRIQPEYGNLPICMAKTQMSFSTNPALKGAPSGHIVEISDIKLKNGAGFIVAIAGDMMTMPGLPKIPTAERIDIDDSGVITGLF